MELDNIACAHQGILRHMELVPGSRHTGLYACCAGFRTPMTPSPQALVMSALPAIVLDEVPVLLQAAIAPHPSLSNTTLCVPPVYDGTGTFAMSRWDDCLTPLKSVHPRGVGVGRVR